MDSQDAMLRGTDGVVLVSAAPEVGVAAATTMGVGPVPIPEVAKMTETGYICGLWIRQGEIQNPCQDNSMIID